MRLDFQRDQLLPPSNYHVIPSTDILECYVPVVGCALLVALPEYSLGDVPVDVFGFIQQHPIEFVDGTLSQLGASYTLASSMTQGRLSVYVYSPDHVYEYYFKDSTGSRTFRFYADTPLMDDFQLPQNAMAGCLFLPGQPCGGAALTLDFAGNDDVISFVNQGFDGSYFFPRLAFSGEGIYYTTGGLTSGVLRVQRVRRSDIRSDPPGSLPGPLDPSVGAPDPLPDPTDPLPDPTDPGGDPAPVPEPATWAMVGLSGACVLWLRRRTSGCRQKP